MLNLGTASPFGYVDVVIAKSISHCVLILYVWLAGAFEMSMFSMIFWFDMSDDSFFMREEFATTAIIIIAAATPTIIGKYFFGIMKNA